MVAQVLPALTSGDSWSHAVTLRDEDGERVAVDASDTVRAALLTPSRDAVLIDNQSVDVATPQAGSDLDQGVVVPVIAPAQSGALGTWAPLVRNGVAWAVLAIEVDTAGAGTTVQTYTFTLEVKRGHL